MTPSVTLLFTGQTKLSIGSADWQTKSFMSTDSRCLLSRHVCSLWSVLGKFASACTSLWDVEIKLPQVVSYLEALSSFHPPPSLSSTGLGSPRSKTTSSHSVAPGLSKEKYPKLTAYIERLQGREAYKRALRKIEEVDKSFSANL